MTTQLIFPGIDVNSVVDRECVIAMFSEVCAEAARLSVLGCHVSACVRANGLDVDIQSPVVSGPFACRWVTVTKGRPYQLRTALLNVFEDDGWRCARYSSHTWDIWYDAPVSVVEPVIEEILRHFALMARNLDATRVFSEVA